LSLVKKIVFISKVHTLFIYNSRRWPKWDELEYPFFL